MYYVVNANGSKYGPASKEMIQQWNREGRIAPDAYFEDGATEIRVPRSDVLPDSPTTAPPVSPHQTNTGAGYGNPYQSPQQQQYGGSQSQYGQQQQYGNQGYGQQQYGQQQYGQQQYGQYGQPNMYGNIAPNVPGKITVVPGGHSTAVAGLLAFFTTIGGYIYNKQYAKGVAVFIGAIVLTLISGGLLGLVAAIAVTIDCYKIAERLNRGEAVDQWQFF